MPTSVFRFPSHCRRGSASVEFAIVVPILLTLIFGIEEIGRLFWTQGTLEFAVTQAARCAAINTTLCGSAAEVETFASSKALGMAIPSSDFALTTPPCGHKVTISYGYVSFVGKIIPYQVTLSATSCHS